MDHLLKQEVLQEAPGISFPNSARHPAFSLSLKSVFLSLLLEFLTDWRID